MDRNSAALKRQGGASAKSEASLLGLAGAISGVGDAATKSSGKMGMFSKVMLGINLATGLLEPAAAGLVVTMGTMAAAFGGAAVGLGAYGLVIKNVQNEMKKLKQLQTAAATGNKAAGKALQAYLKTLTPAFQAFNNQLDATKTSYQNWGKSLEAPVLAPLVKGLKLVQPLLKQLSPTVRVVSAALGGLVGRIGNALSGGLAEHLSKGGGGKGGPLAEWLAAMKPAINSAITGIGVAVGHIVVGIGGILKAFAPFVPKFMDGLDKITARFAKWGQTLTSHSGFQSLIQMWTSKGPQVNKIFSNLVTILVNVGRNMAGIGTPSNSAALLNILVPLSGIVAKLSQNQGLVKFVLYFMLLKSALGQVKAPLTAGSSLIGGIVGAVTKSKSAFTDFRAGFVSSAAAASKATGIWGTVGGVIATVGGAIRKAAAWTIGWTRATLLSSAAWVKNTAVMIGSKIATLAQAAASKVAAAGQWLLNIALDANPIGIVVLAVVALIGIFVALWVKCKWFRDFWKALWHDLQNWAGDAWHAIQKAAGVAWDFIKAGIRVMANVILGIFGAIIHGAADAFGWIPGLGDKLKGAAAAFDRFRARVNKALGGINNKSVSVHVGFDAAPGKPGHQLLAARGARVPGWGGGDKWPALLEGGEAVVPKHLVPAIAPFLKAHGVPGFAAGGIAGGGGMSVHTAFPSVSVMAAAVLRVVQHLAQRNANSLFAGAGGGLGTGGAGVTRWAPVILAALGLLGQSPGWLGLVERRMNQESGGNPYAINKWDSNWAAGTPSVGLMQVIGPTFAAYAGPFRNVGPFAYGTSEAPLANIYAGLNYALHRYGTLAALAQPGGYDQGGWLMPGRLGLNTTSKPERVVSGRQEDAMTARLDAILGALDELIGATHAAPGRTAAGVAGAIGGTAHGAMYSAMYSAR